MHKTPDADALAALKVIRFILSKTVPKASFYIVSDWNLNIPFPKHLQPTDPVIRSIDIPSNSTAYIIDHNFRERSLLQNWEHEKIDEYRLIDHHNNFSTNLKNLKTLIDVNASSTCELLFNYLEGQDKIKITKDIATTIYIGIFVDSLLFQTPLKENLIRILYKLIDKYGAEVDKNHLHLRGKYFMFKKRMAEIIFLCSTKSKISDAVSVKIEHERLLRMWNDYVSVTHIATEILNTRGINFVVIRYETKPGWWTILVSTNLFDNINSIIEPALRKNVHYFVNLNKEQAKNKSKRLLKQLRDVNYSVHIWEAIIEEHSQEQKLYDA